MTYNQSYEAMPVSSNYIMGVSGIWRDLMLLVLFYISKYTRRFMV